MRGIVRYFASEDGVAPAFLPSRPRTWRCCTTTTGSWSCPGRPGSLESLGDAAQGYVVFRSADGRSWDEGTSVGAGTSVVISASLGETVWRGSQQKARAGSPSSEVVGARRSPVGQAEVLVALGFDRLRESNLPLEAVGLTVGDVVRMDLRRANAFDGVVAHGEAVAEAGWFFESASDTRLAELDLLARARVLFWNAGEEGSVDTTFTPAHQEQVAAFYEAGGALWVTGAEVLWDLDARGDAADQAFAETVLGVRIEGDDAGTEVVIGTDLLADLDLSFSEEVGAPYPVEYPDILQSDDTAIATYVGGLEGVAATLGPAAPLRASVRASETPPCAQRSPPPCCPPSWRATTARGAGRGRRHRRARRRRERRGDGDGDGDSLDGGGGWRCRPLSRGPPQRAAAAPVVALLCRRGCWGLRRWRCCGGGTGRTPPEEDPWMTRAPTLDSSSRRPSAGARSPRWNSPRTASAELLR